MAWVWCLIFSFLAPEVLTFLRSLRIIFFKHWDMPRFSEFAFVLSMEIAGAVGTALLVFQALSQLDASMSLALTNCVAVVPGVLTALSRGKDDDGRWVKVPLDVAAVIVQLSGALVRKVPPLAYQILRQTCNFQLWPVLQWINVSTWEDMSAVWSIPVGLLLASCSWWECFVEKESPVPFVRWMRAVRDKMIDRTR